MVSVATNLDTLLQSVKLGQEFIAELVLDLNEISIDDIGVEIAFTDVTKGAFEIISKKEMEVTNLKDRHVTFTVKIPSDNSGVYNYGFRIFPKNPNLAHRQDFNLIRWF